VREAVRGTERLRLAGVFVEQEAQIGRGTLVGAVSADRQEHTDEYRRAAGFRPQTFPRRPFGRLHMADKFRSRQPQIFSSGIRIRIVPAMTPISPWLRLEQITAANVDAACALAVRPEQNGFVAPVAHSLAQAFAHGSHAWPRLVVDRDRLVGFVMGSFDPSSPIEAFRCGIWRLNIAAEYQRRGYGRFAVAAICSEARSRGERRVSVLWLPGPHGPESFYLGLGFRPTGEWIYGQVAAELRLA
jgi:diamine N-acetyltransferase